MGKEAVFTMKLEAELRDAFMKEAEASHRPASQIVRELMRDFVKAQTEKREYEVWLDAELDKAIAHADDPNTKWYTQEELKAGRWKEQRESLLARLAAQRATEDADFEAMIAAQATSTKATAAE